MTSELPAPRLTCREVVALLNDHLEDVLPRRERLRVEAHLESCPECAAYVQQLRTTIGTLGRLHADHVPRSVLADLLKAFASWRPGA